MMELPMDQSIEKRARETAQRINTFFSNSHPPAIDPFWLDVPLGKEAAAEVIRLGGQIQAAEERIAAILEEHERKYTAN